MARLRYRKDQLVARHAHGYVAQVLADLGLIGLLSTLALAAAWMVAAARTTGARFRPRGFGWDAERVGVAALALTALAFGIQSALDWTWFVPGTAVPALLAAGFVAGRGPLPALAGGGDAPTLELAAPGPASGDGRAPGRAGWRSALGRPQPGRLVAAVVVVVATLLCVWAVWQPERAERRVDDALALLESGKPAAAAKAAGEAHDIDPLSPKPLLVKASAEDAAGSREAALMTLEQAVVEHRANAGVWLRLAEFQLSRLGQPQAALQTLRGALYLDPRSARAQQTFFDARARIRGQAAPGVPPVPVPAP
jgi:tetratricopeptide (TPR) repeat protein